MQRVTGLVLLAAVVLASPVCWAQSSQEDCDRDYACSDEESMHFLAPSECKCCLANENAWANCEFASHKMCHIAHCTRCASTTQCKQCAPRWGLNADATKCLACADKHCAVCTKSDHCEKCEPGHVFYHNNCVNEWYCNVKHCAKCVKGNPDKCDKWETKAPGGGNDAALNAVGPLGVGALLTAGGLGLLLAA